MKKGLTWLCVLFLFSGCALLPRRGVEINWPERIEYMEASCELDMAWKDMNYSGSMSLAVEYPEKLQMEVYGPFGETVVYLRLNRGTFLLVAGDEKFRDVKDFEHKFGITVKDFMDDITLRGLGKGGARGSVVARDGYDVVYDLEKGANRICWEGKEGKICMRFLEARFDRG